MTKEEFRKKAENFWYYYKWYVVGAIILILTLLVGIRSCNRKVHADLHVLFAADRSPNSILVAEMQDWLASMTPDVNQDGEAVARVMTTATIDQWSGNNTAAMVVQATTGEAVLYFLTDETYKILHDNGMLQTLPGESPYMEGDRYLLKKSGALDAVPVYAEEEEEIYLCIRKVAGTNLDGSERHIKQEELAKSILKRLIEQEK